MRAYWTQEVMAIERRQDDRREGIAQIDRQQLAEHRADQDRHQQGRDRQHEVADPHQEIVDATAGEAADQPDR